MFTYTFHTIAKQTYLSSGLNPGLLLVVDYFWQCGISTFTWVSVGSENFLHRWTLIFVYFETLYQSSSCTRALCWLVEMIAQQCPYQRNSYAIICNWFSSGGSLHMGWHNLDTSLRRIYQITLKRPCLIRELFHHVLYPCSL